jgi:hypothetical protein
MMADARWEGRPRRTPNARSHARLLREGSCTDSDPASRGDYHQGWPMVKLQIVFYNR